MKRAAWILLLAMILVLDAGAARLNLRSAMTAEEFQRTGLYKLSDGELAALEAWLDQRQCPPVKPPKPTGGDVYFNTSTHKYHCPSCSGARACTRNCISVSRSEAIDRGGVACKICGGSCP